MSRCSISFQPQGILAEMLWFGLFFLPAATETSFNFHPGTRPAVSKGHLCTVPRRDAWTEAALARMRLGSWPCNTAYVAFIGNTDSFPFGSSLLPRVAYEVQEQGGCSQPVVHPDCQENPVCSVAFSPRRRTYHGALWMFPFCSHSTISKPLHGHLKPCRARLGYSSGVAVLL